MAPSALAEFWREPSRLLWHPLRSVHQNEFRNLLPTSPNCRLVLNPRGGGEAGFSRWEASGDDALEHVVTGGFAVIHRLIG